MAKPTLPDSLWNRLERAREKGLFEGEGYTSPTDALRGILKEKLDRVEAQQGDS